MGIFSFVSNSQNVFPSGCNYIRPLSIVPKKLENIVCIYIYILLHNASIDDIGIMNESIVDLKKLKL